MSSEYTPTREYTSTFREDPLLSSLLRRLTRRVPAAEETSFMSFHLLSVGVCVIKFRISPRFPRGPRHWTLITSDPRTARVHRQNSLSSKLRLEIRERFSAAVDTCIILRVRNVSRSRGKVESHLHLHVPGACLVFLFTCRRMHVESSATCEPCTRRLQSARIHADCRRFERHISAPLICPLILSHRSRTDSTLENFHLPFCHFAIPSSDLCPARASLCIFLGRSSSFFPFSAFAVLSGKCCRWVYSCRENRMFELRFPSVSSLSNFSYRCIIINITISISWCHYNAFN